MAWVWDPILTDPHLRCYNYPEDANYRALRDGEVIAAACRNAGKDHLLEIGTSTGQTTAVMARNAPAATVHTVNIPPEEIAGGGTLVTHAPTRDEIGAYYRSQGLTNIRQIFANTANWVPDIPRIDVAFIDGCHDLDFVINDTRKVLSRCTPGSILLWHDFNPALAYRFPWIGEVVDAIDWMVQERILVGPVFHLQDSWVAIHRVS
jgi:predicted O-methyltransferase YrrM